MLIFLGGAPNPAASHAVKPVMACGIFTPVPSFALSVMHAWAEQCRPIALPGSCSKAFGLVCKSLHRRSFAQLGHVPGRGR